MFDVPPGHDAYTIGDASCVMLEWSGVRATTGFALEPHNRVIATLLFTDLVGSTERARHLGDVAWHDLLSRHYEAVRTQLERFRGREFETTGDGTLATFESTAAALRCAAAIVGDAATLGLRVRAGVHVGEVQVLGSTVRGLAVHEAARVMSAAAANEVLASETTVNLASASNLRFVDRGVHQLRGLADERRLYAYVPTLPRSTEDRPPG
ncbi:MAG: adenylate/guanylate cyclase domain-containing protein [Nitriliruptorales bacterium]